MRKVMCLLTAAALCACAGLAAGESALRVRVLAMEPGGAMATGLGAGDWQVRVGGRDARVVSVRTPQEMGQKPMKWVIVTLPVQDRALRQITVLAIGRFLETLPATDEVLLVNRGRTGLACLTPGFTARPSLWAKGLEKLVAEFGGQLEGSVAPFKLPPSPAAEAQEPMTPISAFLRDQEKKEMPRRSEDTKSHRSVLDDYAPHQLGGLSSVVVETLGELGRLAHAVAAEPGEKEMLLFSRNEIDDLANPIWGEAVRRSGPNGAKTPGYGRFTATREDNELLQVQMMMTDLTLGRLAVRDAFAREGLIVHSVARRGSGYEGAFGETVSATGGFGFPLDETLPLRIPKVLAVWPQAYELTLEAPGTDRPSRLEVKTGRKDLKLIAPQMR